MNAVRDPDLQADPGARAVLADWAGACKPMTPLDLDEVDVLEHVLYPFPWTRGNFADSIEAGYGAWVLRAPDRRLLGYCVMMMAVDEAHLLNISIAPQAQGRGLGRRLLDWAEGQARALHAFGMLLEVRPSNVAAKTLYERAGYSRIGLRRAYYPAEGGREDAIVMHKVLMPKQQEGGHGG